MRAEGRLEQLIAPRNCPAQEESRCTDEYSLGVAKRESADRGGRGKGELVRT